MAQSRRFEFVVDDDDGENVVALQQPLAEIPLLTVPLGDEAQDVYWKWCHILRDRGLLTEETRTIAEDLAIAQQDIGRALAKGASTRYPMETRQRCMRALNKLNVGRSISTTPAAQNPYARFGFARRAGLRRHDQD